MKQIITIAMLLFIIVACSKEKEPTPEFTAAEKGVLKVLNGTFIGEEFSLGQLYKTDKIQFSPSSQPIEKTTWQGNVYMCGTVSRIQNMTVGGTVTSNYFFKIETSSNSITLYSYNTSNGDFDGKNEKLKLQIENDNTIRMCDYGLTDNNLITYTKGE